MKLWPRFLCIRDKAGKIIEERQFDTPDSVPAGEGWENITDPVPDAAPVSDSREVKALQRKLADEEAATTGLSKDLAQARAELADANEKLVDQETMLATANSRAAAAEAKMAEAEAKLAALEKTTTAKPKG